MFSGMNSLVSSVRDAFSRYRRKNDDQQYPLLDVVVVEDSESSRQSIPYKQNVFHKTLSTTYKPLSSTLSSEAQLLGSLPDPAVQTRSQLSRWRRTLIGTTILAALVLIFNVIWLVVVIMKYTTKAGVSTLYEGSCSTTAKINLWLHIIINVLSTALMGASNYAMQCLNSPTREEVDRAHQMGEWLSVGLTNMKNLAYILKRRVIPFIILFLSTWPLHFVWNSIVFSTRQTNMFSMLIVTPDFLSSSTFDGNLQNIQNSGGYDLFKGFDFTGFTGTRRNITIQTSPNGPNTYTGGTVPIEYDNSTTFLSFASNLHTASQNSSSMQRLDSADCMREYSTTFLSNQRNLLVVIKTPVSLPSDQAINNGSMLAVLDSRNWNQDLFTAGGAHWNPSAWICSTVNDSASILLVEKTSRDELSLTDTGTLDLTCDLNKALQNLNTYNNWTIASQYQNQTYEVDYCLAEIVPELCQVQFSIYLMVAVLVCNVCKVICMVLTQFVFTELPLVVLGDAIASFLTRPDPTSEGICLTQGPNRELVSYTEGTERERAKRRLWAGKPKLWSDVSRGTWMTLLILVLAAIAFGIAMLYQGSTSLGLESFSSLSFGSINPSTLLITYGENDDPTSESGWNLLRIVMLANSPQIYFSLIYFLYNRSYTAMVSMAEWTRFALERKSLRVSQPTGIQRSTYWLQLPYTYSIPLLIGSGLVHWILSESLFLVRISFFDRDGQPTFPTSPTTTFTPSSNTLTVPGYSPKAILAAIIVSTVMLTILIWNEFRAYKSAMPLVVNSSFAISAACHRPYDDDNAAYKKVMWGATSQPGGDLPGHCCITSYEVETPIVGKNYQ